MQRGCRFCFAAHDGEVTTSRLAEWLRPAGGGRREAHSMRDSAHVTAPGAVTSMSVAVSTRPNRQNRSTRSRMSAPLVQKQKLRVVNR